jgi:NAD(P)-dependent dehydrogenase (short-subunit alcohol dehydrogenase family)
VEGRANGLQSDTEHNVYGKNKSPVGPGATAGTLMEPVSFDLNGQVALVTGAGRGIGHDLALALATAGSRTVAGVRPRGQGPGGLEAVELDLRDGGSTRAAIDKVRPTILVNNAGVGTNHDALDATEDEWNELLDVNLRGLFFACQSAARHMVERGYGRIINISSQAGHVGIKRNAAYCASKGGVEALTKVLALEWGPRGITVNAVAPGFIRTTVNAEALDRQEFVEEVIARIPVGRAGTTTDVAAAVLFLASPAASFVNGTSVLVDGGWTAQ